MDASERKARAREALIQWYERNKPLAPRAAKRRVGWRGPLSHDYAEGLPLGIEIPELGAPVGTHQHQRRKRLKRAGRLGPGRLVRP